MNIIIFPKKPQIGCTLMESAFVVSASAAVFNLIDSHLIFLKQVKGVILLNAKHTLSSEDRKQISVRVTIRHTELLFYWLAQSNQLRKRRKWESISVFAITKK